MIVKVYTLYCDLPRAKHPHDHHGVSSCTAWIGQDCITLPEVQKKARKAGWLLKKSTVKGAPARHYCPAARKVIEA